MVLTDIYDKSYELLKRIASAQKEFGFTVVLIGGWAAYLHNPHMKSRDIDFAVEEGGFWKLRNFLVGDGFSETFGGHLGKKGFTLPYGNDKIDVDVYYEKIGDFPVTTVFEHAKTQRIDETSMKIADETTLLALKVICASDRIGTPKGEKDITDIISLLDAHLEKVDFPLLEKFAGTSKPKKTMKAIFGSYQTAKHFYPLTMEKFLVLKGALKRRGLL